MYHETNIYRCAERVISIEWLEFESVALVYARDVVLCGLNKLDRPTAKVYTILRFVYMVNFEMSK